jgi:hypothetical protein
VEIQAYSSVALVFHLCVLCDGEQRHEQSRSRDRGPDAAIALQLDPDEPLGDDTTQPSPSGVPDMDLPGQ